MTAAVALPQHRARWSAAAKCPRWAALGALGYEPREPSDRTRFLWLVGKIAGQAVAAMYADKHGADNLILEKPVPWAAGVLHTDIFIPQLRLPVEVKSHQSLDVDDSEYLQLAGEIHYDPDATDLGVLHVVNRATGQHRADTFRLTGDWKAAVEDRAAEVVRALQTGGDDMPDCTCATPDACRWTGCPHTDVAWEGWQPPPLPEVEDYEVMDQASLWMRYRREEDEANEAAKAANRRRREVQERLAGLVAEGEYAYGGFVVKRKTIRNRASLDGAKLALAGFSLPDEFWKPGAVYDKWTIRQREGAAVAADDPGDEAPF